jgi:hypothetical protein
MGVEQFFVLRKRGAWIGANRFDELKIDEDHRNRKKDRQKEKPKSKAKAPHVKRSCEKTTARKKRRQLVLRGCCGMITLTQVSGRVLLVVLVVSLILFSSSLSVCWRSLEIAQANPVLQVVGEAGPQHLHLHLHQTAHVKLPQT